MTQRQLETGHYGQRDLAAKILMALRQAGKDPANLDIDDLVGFDEFHLGGRAQTIRLAEALRLSPRDHLLDIGCGIGGPARYFAKHHKCRVIGLDLTPEFIAAAEMLTLRCNLADKVSFQIGNATSLPFLNQSFDAACLIHVGMNIADKWTVLTEARRILRPNGRLVIYDVMLMSPVTLTYPMPWSLDSSASFVSDPALYRQALTKAGFMIEAEHNRRADVLAEIKNRRAQTATDSKTSLGLHLIIGARAKERLQNVMTALEHGDIAPVEIIARAID